LEWDQHRTFRLGSPVPIADYAQQQNGRSLITASARGAIGIQRIAVGATVEPVAPCSFSGCMMNANS
jgi:hypothetical protein